MENQSFWDSKMFKVIVGIVTIVALIEILAKVFGKSQSDKDKEQAGKNSREENKELYNQVPPSYSDSYYRDSANALDTALIKSGTEDESAVFEVFKEVKNISDIRKLIAFFGNRRSAYHPTKVNLPQAISELLSTGEKAKLNKIISSKKIDYRFK